MFTKDFLLIIRRQALRRRIWYSALDCIERGILSISARIIDDVKSTLLNIQIVKIIAKLKDAGKSGFIRNLERHGVERIQEIQKQATRLGYKSAGALSKDLNFLRYLMFLDYNQPIGWRIYSP